MVQNFLKVDDRVFRCAQPDEEGFRWLYAQGIRNVVKLNEDDGYQGAPDEFCLALGMQLFKSPISILQQVLTEPDLQEICGVIDYLLTCTGPVVVHCWRGIDRTGLVIAFYRIATGWTIKAAMEEWRQLHGDSELLQGLRKAFADLAPTFVKP